ncbi:OmpH family outer membrane protein [Entomomonas asaccharolytica]|uniref:OmpH family outer membrane protein n=1 Tax=Entomomonas asaccharolytica TaxID=2785331 RepID=A0A974RWV2_9GAMM|nr:OmpH family outer membrane protein [Entomomonas asaccharolytica]QQP85596.1 OmpH family outer membrane protein [Entomomonas asaccharolytica]
MYKLTKLALVAFLAFSAPAYAEMKIAVLNYQMALLESDVAKKYAVDSEKRFGPRITKLKSLEEQAKKLQDNLIKNGSKMKQAERERLELELNQKARDFQMQSKELNDSKMKADQDMLKIIKPKLDKAVEDALKAGGYDLVLESGAVVDVKPQYDITKQVIDRLNKMK